MKDVIDKLVGGFFVGNVWAIATNQLEKRVTGVSFVAPAGALKAY